MTEKIVKAFMTKLEMLFGENNSSKGIFLAFCLPGIPMSSQDLDFSLTNKKSELNPQEALQASSNFSHLVNQVPKLSSRWLTDGSLLWNEYNIILDQAEVAFEQATEEEKNQLEEARNFVKKNQAVYDKYQQLYLQATFKYNSKKLSDDQEPTERAKVNNAEKNWINFGKRKEVETNFSIIDQITGRNPQIIWGQRKNEYQQSRLTSLDKQVFYQTYFYPEVFYQDSAKNQWTKLTLNAREIKELSSQKDNSSQETSSPDELELAVSNLSVELIQVKIIRPWLDVGIFKSRAWRFPDAREPLSDGKPSSKGSLLAYATSIIFMRNLQITLNSQVEHNLEILKDIESSLNSDSQSMKSEGMQIVAFVCQKLPKSPNPDLSLKWLGELPWVGKTEEELRSNLNTWDGNSIITIIRNDTEFELQKIYDDKTYGIYKDPPLDKVKAKSIQGFSTSQDLFGGPEGWLVYDFNKKYNIMLYWQNFYTEKNKGCISFIPKNIKLTRENLKTYTSQEKIIRIQGKFICDATIGSGFQKAIFNYTIKTK